MERYQIEADSVRMGECRDLTAESAVPSKVNGFVGVYGCTCQDRWHSVDDGSGDQQMPRFRRHARHVDRTVSAWARVLVRRYWRVGSKTHIRSPMSSFA